MPLTKHSCLVWAPCNFNFNAWLLVRTSPSSCFLYSCKNKDYLVSLNYMQKTPTLFWLYDTRILSWQFLKRCGSDVVPVSSAERLWTSHSALNKCCLCFCSCGLLVADILGSPVPNIVQKGSTLLEIEFFLSNTLLLFKLSTL